ncbi:MAG: CPBP family intramembrane metalloprotease [Flavobacteriales bacterium]|nr:CPBP family intramembrane metalloprotease [Flavobacteriales bacterium]
MEEKNPVFQKPSMQLLLIAGLCLLSSIVFSTIAGILTALFFNLNLSGFTDYNDPNVISGLKFFQLMSAIGLFIIPPIIYGFLITKKPLVALSIHNFSTPINWLIILLIMIVSMPIMSWLVEFNSTLSLPEFLSPLELWMKQSESQAEKLTHAFLSFYGWSEFLYVFLIVAIIPAFGEEFLFRGVLQPIFTRWTKNYHLAIWITAILFSALHMQFYGFIPRMVLGALFGYVFYWSGSLWLPIFGHLINNGSVVTISFLFPEMIENSEIKLFGEKINIIATVTSAIVVFVLLFLFYSHSKKIEKIPRNS